MSTMAARRRAMEQSKKRLTLDTSPAPIYGCTGLFDLCGNADLMSLSFTGMSPFLDWLAWEPTDVCILQQYFVNWVRPAYADGSPTAGYLADPCADPQGVEWGACDFILNNFARLRRMGPTRDVTRIGLRLCDTQPRYRLDGTRITNDLEFDMRLATEVILQDLMRMVVDGNAATPGQFSGLETLIKTGYTDSQGRPCEMMDSIVLDMNGNGMDGGNGITWNGTAVANTYSFIDILKALVRRIKQRISWSPTLASQALQVGDIVIAAPTRLLECILDAYTCWSVCPGVEFREANLNTFDARQFRDQLNGGMFGAGRIFIDGFEIPLVPYDWGLIKGGGLFDAYILTRGVGNERLLRGQFNNMNRVAGEGASMGADTAYMATDNGRLLTWAESDHTCVRQIVEMQPRLVVNGPWAQVRIQDIACTQPGPLDSPDPTSTYFPEGTFYIAGS